jgi:hypothetical protein
MSQANHDRLLRRRQHAHEVALGFREIGPRLFAFLGMLAGVRRSIGGGQGQPGVAQSPSQHLCPHCFVAECLMSFQ